MPNEIETFTETYVSNKIPCINEIDEICSILSCSSEYENPECPYSEDGLEEFTEEEVKISNILKDWLEKLTNKDTKILEDLHQQFGSNFPPCTTFADVSTKTDVIEILGATDENGELHGDAEIFYKNGDYLWTDFNHGIKEGSASIVYKSGDHILGNFKNDRLSGLVNETLDYCDHHNVTREVQYQNGVRHGFYREFGPDGKFWTFGRYYNGEKSGKQWKRVEGNAYLYGELDDKNKPHGDSILYFYPDICTVIRGNYHHGILERGHLVHLSSISNQDGIIEPNCKEYYDDENNVFTYDNPSRFCISKNPFQRDPYEMRHVFVKNSEIPFAGEGLWAKTDIKKGSLVALFNGVKQRQIWGVSCQQKAWSDYRICCDKEMDLDILPEHVSLDNYQATLAHKTCHSFDFNAHFEPLWHPRFGKIMSIVSNFDIKAGKEVLANYNYSLSRSPDWYREAWFKHLRDVLQWSEEKIYSWVQREIRNSGIYVEMIPPSKDSDRYVACDTCGEHVASWDQDGVTCYNCGVRYHTQC